MDINPLEVESALPDYKVIRKLNAGGFGAVFEAEHRNTGHRVAIKAIHMHRQSLEATRKEVVALHKLSNHTHIVTILRDPEESTSLQNGGLFTIVMELLHKTLRQLLAEAPGKIIPHEQACAIALGVALALERIESTNIVHRDIKPSNIMFATDGTVKVTDLGIAKTFEGTSTTVGGLVGTPYYMAPEQWGGRGSRIRSATDVYALGVVLYQMVSGGLPFDSADSNELSRLHRKVPPPRLPDFVPARIAKVIYSALEKQQQRRPSARAFACALATAATAEYGPYWTDRTGVRLHLDQELKEIIAGPIPPVSPPKLPPRGPGRRWWMIVVPGALVVSGIVAWFVYFLSLDPKHCGLGLTDSNYGSVTTEPYGCIGISSDIGTFHIGQTNNPDENLEDVGRLIMKQNQQVSGDQPMTLVYIAALTDPPDKPSSQESPGRVAAREEMMGIAAAQLLNNTQFRPVSILFANAGARMQGASTIGTFLKALVAG
uniref:serine/threonine-protein kinase n=1 Tax=Frankia sp. CiP3 TaxID=2880971 RepID=UPI001EF57719